MAEYAPCWKEKRLHHCFLDGAVLAGLSLSGFTRVGKKKDFISVFLISLCKRRFCVWVCPVLERQ